MTEEQLKQEKLYQATLAIARVMFSRGLLTEDELTVINAVMLKKYKPLLGGLGVFIP
jgi:hypothetical protein